MSLPESSWDDLLQFIDEGRVIPIVGPELLRVGEGEDATFLDQCLARRLAERLGVAAVELPEDGAINHVVCQYLRQNPQNRRERVYTQLRPIMNELHAPVPEALRQLAEIRHFTLYVTTTVDSLLEDALAAARGIKPDVVVYTPSSSEVHDLPREIGALARPLVFHLMGRVSSTPDYVLTEEDTLEFLHAMQSGRRPNLLFDELKTHHLLFIGCSHPDWLARFFIRLVKGARLSGQRNSQEIVADRTISRDRSLAIFLQHFSYGTQVFSEGDAAEFVDELARRYHARHPSDPIGSPAAPPPGAEREMPAGAVFVSYASEDRSAAEDVAKALRDIGADVWIDKSGLQVGDEWDRTIQRNIRHCSLFLPLVSRNTEARLEGYFRREWRWAVDRTLGMEDSTAFIIPILIDKLPMESAKVPEAFKQKHALHLSAADAKDTFKTRLTELLRSYRKREKCTS